MTLLTQHNITEFSTLIENESGGFGQRGHALRIPSVALGKREILEQARQPQGQDGVPFTTGLVAQRTAEPGFTVLMTMPF